MEAEMDPWATVDLVDGESLFGFCIKHSRTGGLSWVVSTPVLHLEDGLARTRSGRRYRLGRALTISGLPNEESRVAFELLVRPLLRSPEEPPLLADVDWRADPPWLSAQKMARHLGLVAPPRHDLAAVRDFVRGNLQRYAVLRREGGHFHA